MKRTLVKETTSNIGKDILLQGWVDTRRDHGKITFIDIRDRSGIVQLVGKDLSNLRSEDVVEIVGVVKDRPASMVNTKIPTGSVEVDVKEVNILSKAKELPLPIDTDGLDISEEVRLKYRYLDLRRPRLQKNIRLRSKFVDLVRQYLFSQDFTEIETPILTKSTPEGSRDFLVPSRLQPGKFYALPQSPQQYKQLLMVAGFERYFQIARCLRDEDPRADRGFEHTQIDIEMSFVERTDVMAMDEGLITAVIEQLGYTIKEKPFPVITYADAMKKFGADKFDLRSDEDKKNGVLAFSWVIDFPFFEKDKEGGWTFTHNPFSAPLPEFKDSLLKKERIGEILTSQYDLVCNGYEVGGGSIRSHEPEVLQTVFEIMGHKPENVKKQFGHMLEAFSYGVPPHGGLAHGIERILMTITNEPYLREVVAFPMTSSGQTSVMEAPSEVTFDQLKEVGLQLASKKSTVHVGFSASGEGGNPKVYEKIVEELKKNSMEFKAFEHEPVFTSEDAANIRGTSLSEGAKALLLYADGKPIMVTVPGDRKIDMKTFKKLYQIKDLRMATPEEVKKVTTVAIGCVPPFGHIFRIPLYMDKRFQLQETVAFNAGMHTKSIRMSQKDFEKLSVPIIGEFSS